MVLLIDNYDSFTYNLFQAVEILGYKTLVKKHDEITIQQIRKLNPKNIIISPGPGRPKDAGISMKVIETFYQEIPILGVCLGHQCIGELFGVKVVGAKKILHGKTTKIFHQKNGLFKSMPSPFAAARYNSLVIDSVPKNFFLDATDENKEIMAIRHSDYPLFGVQFHPESFLTEKGNTLLKNFFHEAS